MKIRNLKLNVQNCEIFLLAIFALFTISLPLISVVSAEEGKWSGVDESVVEKYAKEHGREAREPLINTDQGDMLLFVFLLAGVIGGFVGGYYWRILMVEKIPRQVCEKRE